MKVTERLFRVVRVLLILSLITFGVIGCGGGGGSTGGGPSGGGSSGGGGTGGGSSGAPDIALSTIQLDFGGVVKGSFSDRSITMQNTGTADLSIGPLVQPSAPFEVVEQNCFGFSLSPSGTCSIKVRFSPTVQENSTGTFNITSNDINESTVPITLKGSGMSYNVSINRVDNTACPDLKLLISVADPNGDPVTILNQTNFRLFENSNPKAISKWSQVSANAPISAGLVLDYSSSITDTKPIEDAAKAFVGSLKAGVDEAEVIKFDKDVFTILGFTTEKVALVSAIDSQFPAPFTDPDGTRLGTSLYDAILRSIEDTSKRQPGTASAKLSVIALTDGVDDYSTATLDDVINFAIQKGIPVFTVSVGTAGAEQMQELAKQTGGQYFLADTTSDLEEVYLKISQILSNQYLIEYTTSSFGGNTVSLDVEVDYNGLQGADSRDAMGC